MIAFSIKDNQSQELIAKGSYEELCALYADQEDVLDALDTIDALVKSGESHCKVVIYGFAGVSYTLSAFTVIDYQTDKQKQRQAKKA